MLFKTIPKYKCNSNTHEILSYWYAILYFTYLPNVGHYYNPDNHLCAQSFRLFWNYLFRRDFWQAELLS